MTLLILTWQYPPDACGGTEVATRELARALARRGHHVEIVTTGCSRRTETACAGRVVVQFVRGSRLRCCTYVTLMVSSIRACRRVRADVVHAQALWMGPISLVIRACCGIPYVLWGRGEDVRRPRMFGGPVRWASVHGASAVLALNATMALELDSHGASAVRVLGNGAGLTGLRVCSKREARTRLKIPDSARVIMFVGSLRQSKGVDDLLRAFARVSERRPDALLLVVGEGSESERLTAYARAICRDNSVVLAGSVPHEDVGVYLSSADVFALPSALEGFPMSVAEAMAVGLPIVCCGVGVLPDIVRDGINGRLVRFGDVDGLAEVLGDLLDNPHIAQQMGRRSKAWARRHSWHDVAERFAEICNEVVTAKNARIGGQSERFDSYGIHVR